MKNHDMKGGRNRQGVWIALTALMSLPLLAVSCGGGSDSDPAARLSLTPSSVTPATEQPPPPSADAPSSEELNALLQAEFERLGIDPDKVAAQAPSLDRNAVFDLVVSYRSTYSGATLHWTERMVGDYDMNGEVNVSDLTPISQRWNYTVEHRPPEDANGFECWPVGHPRNGGFSGILNGYPGWNTPADQWRTARVDGDDNGLITAADITPIAQQWHERLDSYRIYRRAPGESEFSMLRLGEEDTYSIPRSIRFKPGATAPDPAWAYRLYYADVTVAPGTYEYYLAPYDSVNDSEGTPSPVVTITFDNSAPPPQPEGNQPPVIKVLADVTSGDAPLRVEFDASGSSDPDGEIVLYVWDWEGDGVVDASSQSSPLAYHIYNDTGWYHPRLTVWDDHDGSATATIDIEVGVGAGGILPPQLELSATPLQGPVPLDVEFTPLVTAVDGYSSGLHYAIDYEGDGEVDYTYGKHPLPPFHYLYEETGSYHPTVTVTNGQGLSTSASVEVTVNDNLPPQAVITFSPEPGIAAQTLHVSGLDSSDQDGSVLTYDWQLDGVPYFGSWETQPGEFDHTFPKLGEHVFSLTVTDSGGVSAATEATIQIVPPAGDLPPVAQAGAEPLIGAAPLKVTLSPEGSYDPENLPLSDRWDVNGDGTFDYSINGDFQYTYDDPGVYTAILEVQDRYGQTDQASVQITVIDNHPPAAVLLASPNSGSVPLMVALDARDSTDPDGDTLSFAWQFDYYPGDSHWATGTALEGHEYRFAGNHVARVRVTDQWGASSVADADIHVDGPGWFVTKIDDGGPDYWSPDIGLELVDGNPAVAYGDGHDMRYARGEDADGLSWTQPYSIEYSDDIYGGVLGPSLSFINGAPCVGWMRHSGVVMYCRALDSAGAGWQSPRQVYAIGGSGSGTDILDVNGNPALLWVDALGHMRYSRSDDAGGDAWSLAYDFGQISWGEGNNQAEMAMVNGKPSVAFVNGYWFGPGINYCWSEDASGQVWASPVSIFEPGNSRPAVSMTTISGNPVVAYYCELGLVFQIAPDGVGDIWTEPVVISPELGAGVGYFGGDEICIVELDGVPAVLDYKMGLWVADNGAGSSWYGPEHIPEYGSGITFALLDVHGQPAIAWQSGSVYYGVRLP